MYQLLVVDDEYEIRNGLCKYFPWDETGFTVAGQAENGREALAFLRTHHVDLVLCDMELILNQVNQLSHLRPEH